MRVLRLFAKSGPQRAIVECDALSLKRDGIEGMRVDSPLRHVLLLPAATLRDLSIAPGALRENVLVDFDALQELQSGTVLSNGALELRLTVHCEPCSKTRPFARADVLEHRRGYLAQIVSPDVLRIGDSLTVDEQRFEPIPYGFAERVAWFLGKRDKPIAASTLLKEIGFHRSHARALPKVLARLPEMVRQRVTFAGNA